MVIHCATNDLHDKSGEEIVQEMEGIYKTCISYGVERVIFSGIVFRRARVDIEQKRLLVNALLRSMCQVELVKMLAL